MFAVSFVSWLCSVVFVFVYNCLLFDLLGFCWLRLFGYFARFVCFVCCYLLLLFAVLCCCLFLICYMWLCCLLCVLIIVIYIICCDFLLCVVCFCGWYCLCWCCFTLFSLRFAFGCLLLIVGVAGCFCGGDG